MTRQCNLDLGLVTPSVFYHSAHQTSTNQKQQQPLTIFYNGEVAACDMTEAEARAIILFATKQLMEDKSRISEPSSYSSSSPITGLSMKRSLQRFLEKRKTRAHAISPY